MLGPERIFGSFVGKKCRSEASLPKRITLKAKISEPITKSESKTVTLFRVEEVLILRSLETKSQMDKTIRTGQKHRIACSRVSLRSPARDWASALNPLFAPFVAPFSAFVRNH